MGADLYINKIRKPIEDQFRPQLEAAAARRDKLERGTPEYAAAQAEVDEAYERIYGKSNAGYFRDSYNDTSVFWRMGLSWWKDVEYDVQDEDSDINVSPAACQRLLDKVEAAPFSVPTKQDLERMHIKLDETGENSVESWQRYYTEKRERLIAFLKLAVENGGMLASC